MQERLENVITEVYNHTKHFQPHHILLMMISNKLIKETKTINMYHIIVGNALTIKALWISKRIFSMLRKSLIDSENSLLQFFKTNSIFAKKKSRFLALFDSCASYQTKISQIYGIQYVVTSDSIAQGI